MELGRELGRAFRLAAERIERHGEMTVASDCIDKLSGSGDVPKKSGIWLPRLGCLLGAGRRRRAAQSLGESKKLAPRLVDGRGITTIGFVGLVDVSVVVDARNRVGAHALNL